MHVHVFVEYFHLQVYSFGEISKGLKPGVEVDVVAVVISHSSQPKYVFLL